MASLPGESRPSDEASSTVGRKKRCSQSFGIRRQNGEFVPRPTSRIGLRQGPNLWAVFNLNDCFGYHAKFREAAVNDRLSRCLESSLITSPLSRSKQR